MSGEIDRPRTREGGTMPLPRVRFTLGRAMLAISGISILLAYASLSLRKPIYRHEMLIRVIEGDFEACALIITSRETLGATLDVAKTLDPGFVATPPYRVASDPVPELSGTLRSEVSPRDRTIRFSIVSDLGSEGWWISRSLSKAISSVTVPGKLDVASSIFEEGRSSRSQVMIVGVIGILWINCILLLAMKSSREKATEHARLVSFWRGRAAGLFEERVRVADAGDIARVEELGLIVEICRDRAEWHARECQRSRRWLIAGIERPFEVEPRDIL
jgi:hypothetical protein